MPLPARVAWYPQPKQHALISCPVEDVLFGGARGGGKTDGLGGDWLAHAQRYGSAARGLFFRQTYPELEEVEQRFLEIFPSMGGTWLKGKRTWTFPSGARLRLRYLENERDAERMQGQSNSWVGADELGNYPTPKAIDLVRATLRSAAGATCYFRASANPGGSGHGWIKARYVDPAPPMTPFTTTETIAGETISVKRCYIPSTLDDNALLMRSDPDYWQRVVAAAGGNEALIFAWRYGRWDVVAGGMLSDVWSAQWHVLEPFEIPAGWRVRRAFDWGSSAPFAVGWFAHTDGESPLPDGRVLPRGSRVHCMELYGYNGKPNEGLRLTNTEIARRIKTCEEESPYRWHVEPGPADTQIFDVVNGTSIADEMATQGIKWKAAQKGPGSRRQGWQLLRQRLKAGMQWPMEEPGLFVFSTCRQFIRTVPVLPRDKTNADDVDSDSEDHCFAGDTKVETSEGSVRIRDLVGKTGYVWTDVGLREFTNCRLVTKHTPTILLMFANSQKIQCTPEHLFLTKDCRWVQAQDLIDETCYNISSQKEDICRFSSLVRRFRNLMVNAFTSVVPIFNTRASDFIWQYGFITMDQFLQDLMFIIAPMIEREIKLKTWNYCPSGAIGSYMPSNATSENRERIGFLRPKRLQPAGINLLKDCSGIKSIMGSIVQKLCFDFKTWYVRSVGQSSKLLIRAMTTPSVLTDVERHFGAQVASTMLYEHAVSVLRRLSAINILNKKHAAQHVVPSCVVSVQPSDLADVYCLKVPGVNRFAIEGGIIVHNCGDMVRYELSIPLPGKGGAVPVRGY